MDMPANDSGPAATMAAADTITISRHDYGVLRAAAVAAVGVAGVVYGIFGVANHADGGVELALNEVLGEALQRANDVLGPMADDSGGVDEAATSAPEAA